MPRKWDPPTRIGHSVVAHVGGYKQWMFTGLLVGEVAVVVAALYYAAIQRDLVVAAIFAVDAVMVWWVLHLLILKEAKSPTVATVDFKEIRFFKPGKPSVGIPREDVELVKIHLLQFHRRPHIVVHRSSAKDFTDTAAIVGFARPRFYLALRRRGYNVEFRLTDNVALMHSPVG